MLAVAVNGSHDEVPAVVAHDGHVGEASVVAPDVYHEIRLAVNVVALARDDVPLLSLAVLVVAVLGAVQ